MFECFNQVVQCTLDYFRDLLYCQSTTELIRNCKLKQLAYLFLVLFCCLIVENEGEKKDAKKYHLAVNGKLSPNLADVFLVLVYP